MSALLLDWSLSLPEHVHVVRMPSDPLAYARMLYATLHDLDQDNYAVVAIERPPQPMTRGRAFTTASIALLTRPRGAQVPLRKFVTQ